MSVVAAYAYQDGKRVRSIDPDHPDGIILAPGEFIWIGLLDPNEAELRGLQRQRRLRRGRPGIPG